MKSATRSGRPYRMVARADAVARTRDRILDAAIAQFWEDPAPDVSLDAVAARAGVSVQTVIRHFGGKEGLFEASVRRESARVEEQRSHAPPHNAQAAVRVLFDHYEELGDRVLRMLSEEGRIAGLRELADLGRAAHRRWCERVFESTLTRLSGADRRRRLAQFVAVCDVYNWKLLRRDSRLSRRQAELAVIELLEPLMEVP